jgi:LPS export ABC transporter protein LptC
MLRLLTIRNLLILVVFLVAGTLLFRGLSTHYGWEPDVGFESIPDNVDLTLKNIKYTKTRDGEPVWTLEADSAAHSMGEGVTRIKNVRMVFHDQQMGDIILTADRGELFPEKKVVKVYSNVTVISPPENTLLTESLEYRESTRILQTREMVKINFDHFEVTGKGMKMDVTRRSFTVLSNVKAYLRGMDG